MSSSAEMRTPVDLGLRVWGMAADGGVFSQTARARNISGGGALLSGIERFAVESIQPCEAATRAQLHNRCKNVNTA